MIKAQICFSPQSDMETVCRQLRELATKDDHHFYSCFLHRKFVEEKGFSTDIVDMIDDILGDKHTYMTEPFDKFADIDWKGIRETTSTLVEKMYVLDSGICQGIQDEMELFTRHKLIMMR